MPEQVEAFDRIIDAIDDGGGFGLFSEQGTGKTVISMAVLEDLLPETVLIICPLSAIELTWVPRLQSLPYTIHRDWPSFKAAKGHRILIVHFQLLSKVIKKIHKFAWSFVLWDESQSAKGRNSGWSRAARRLRKVHRRLALSGTPIDKSPIDVWAQMRFIDHTVLGERWGDFAEKYCRKGGYMNKKWIFNAHKLPEFLKVLEPYLFRLSSEFLDLPPLIVIPIPVELLGQQRRLYDDMTNDSIVTLDDGTVIKADLPITRLAKQEQIVNGFIIDDDGKIHTIGQAKERKLRRMLDHVSEPVVVCCKFKEDIRNVCDTMFNHGRFLSNGVIWGKTRKDRTATVNEFQAGKLDALVVQIRSGGVSIEFTAASDLIVYSMGHSYIDFAQFLKRLHRYGQKKAVRVFVIYAANTVDEDKIVEVERKGKEAGIVVSHFEKGKVMAAKAKKKATPKKKATNNEPEFKYGIDDLAKKLEILPSTARMKLRNAGIKKAGRAYGWNSEAEMNSVVKKLEAA